MRPEDEEALEVLARLANDRSDDPIDPILAAARQRLGMDVCVVSEVTPDHEIVHALEGDPHSFGIRLGDSIHMATSYGHRLLDGRLSNVVADATVDPRVRDLPLTRQAEIGSFVGVRLAFAGGRPFGVLACFSHRPAGEVGPDEVRFLHVLARMVADELERQEMHWEKERLELDQIRHVLQAGSIEMVFQPIVDLDRGTMIGVEALARFGSERGPALWFAEAGEVGLRTELELLCVAAALAQLESLPADAFLSVNASPETIVSPRFLKMLEDLLGGRLVIELSEGARVEDHPRLPASLLELRTRGALLAIDDSSARFGSRAELLKLAPDMVKLDPRLTRGLAHDPEIRDAAASVLEAAGDIDAAVVAEGVETREQRDALQELGVPFGQGWFLGRPGPLAEVTRSTPPGE
jgi:EAL domain-containing protein (putative c-di-GMP-specific phosphodiesterase class I)